jgi:hypothetical protein
MPKVPVLRNQVKQQVGGGRGVSERHNINVTADDFGGQQARDLSNFGSALSETANTLARVAVTQSKAFVRDEVRKGDEHLLNLKQDFMSRKGKDVMGLTTNFQSEVNKYRNEITKEMKKNQKEMFAASFDSTAKRYAEELSRYEYKATLDYDNATKDAQNNTAIKKAISSYDNPNLVKEAELDIENNVRSQYSVFGKDIEDAKVSEAVNNLHSNIAEAVASVSPNKAIKYMNDNWDKFDPRTRDKMKKTIEKMSVQEDSEEMANYLAASGMPIDKQLESVNKIKDPEKQALTRKLVNQKEKDKNDADELYAREVFEAEFDKCAKDPENYKIPYSLPAKQQSQLYNWKRKLIDDAKADKGIGKKIKTDMKLWLELTNLPKSELVKINLKEDKYLSRISPADIKQLSKMQRDSRAFTEVQSLSSVINQVVKSAVDKDDIDGALYLRQKFEEEVNNLPPEKRKSITELNKIKDTMFMEMDVNGDFWDTPYWKMKQQGKTGKPDDRPVGLPDGAEWVDYTVDGKNIRGYINVNDKGEKLLYAPEGGGAWGIYRFKTPDKKVVTVEDNEGE